MRNTSWDGRQQTMVLLHGRPKGMKLVLQERGIDTDGMKAADMQLVLGNYDDFEFEKTAIERVWGEAKQFIHAHCNYTFAGLEQTVIPALQSVGFSTIHKYFRKCCEYMQAYREGNLGGKDVEQVVKLYKSHCQVFGQLD